MKRTDTRRAALLCAALLAPASGYAQDVTHAYQSWFGVFAQGPIAGGVYFQGDLHYRGYDDFSPYWALVRPAVAYRIVPGMFVTLGYAWTPAWRSPGLSFQARVDEHRVWEQWQHELPLADGALKLGLRVRLEQRWRPDAGSDVGHRLRLMVRATIPLRGRWLIAVWDEFFVTFNDTDWGQRAGFDQNRFFAGPGVWAVPDLLRFELGYFNQYLRRANNPAGDLANHAAMLNAFVSWR